MSRRNRKTRVQFPSDAQEAGNIRRELFLLEKLGDCLLSMDRFNDAEGFYQQLLTLAQQLRAVTHIKRAYMKMAILAAGFGKWMQCAELARRALTLSRFFHDHTSKAHMMLLIGRSELDRGNYDMAQSVFTKAIEVCKEHGIHATAAIARRFMVDLAIFRHQKDITVLEHIRDHLALFDYEFDDRAKLKSMIRLGRYCAELDHFTSLKIVSSAKKLLCGPCVEEQPDLLLECFDVYVTLEMLDEAWRILMKIIDSSSLSTADLKKISKRLLVFPLRRRAITIVGLVERGLDDTNTLSQLAYFVPKFTLQVLSEKNDPLAEMISHIQLDDWCSALSCAEAVFAGQAFPPVADGLFGRKRTDEAISQVLLVSRWNIDRVLHWPDLSTLDETSFCCFFDVAYQRILHDGVTLSPSSRAHLHTLMLQGDFDLTHEAAGAVEKIICAANTGCGEMIAMWYDELIEEFLHEDIEGVEIFPFSSKELELKVATVIFALEQETFEKQLQILESSKWLLDKRLFSRHGRHLEQPPLAAVPTDPFMYVYGVARVQLTWTALGGGQVLTSFSRTTEELSFLEECLLRCLQQRGIPERNWNGVKVDELFVSDRHDTGVNPKFYVVADEYLPIDSRGEEGPSRLSEGLTGLSSCFLTIVDAFDRLLHPDICLSVERTPPLVVSRGPLSFTLIRALFLNGTVAVVELDEAAGDDEIEELVDKLRSSPNPSEVLSKYCCYVKSRTALSYWPDLAEHLSIALHKSPTTSPKADEQSDRAGEDDVGKPMRAMLQETVRINNLWMKPLQFRSQKETTEEFKLSKADETALVKLCEDLLRYTKGEATTIISNESGKDRGEGDANRQKRRRKKQAEKPVHGYMSDGADVGRRIKAHVRSQSDAVSRSTSSVLWPAVE
ncbi:hypothetical protein Q1695_015952 [Nippostrongylus brasiliensis]|nr:hypothetical protein Q1695_015952 [Nippostrongylus brasiliensis]